MNRISIAILVIVAASMFPTIADAQQGSIYSWTDKNGVKHFSDRTPEEVAANKDEIPVAYETVPMDTSANTLNNETVVEGADDNQAAAADELSYADQQRLEMQEKRKAQQELQAERQRVCLQAMDRLAQVEPSRRVFYTGENGETTRMDDDERVQMIEEAKGLIAEYCD